MINVAKALADLSKTPGDVIAVPKAQLAELLGELAARQPNPRDLTIFKVAPQPAGAQA
jgi:hypothetical protein